MQQTPQEQFTEQYDSYGNSVTMPLGDRSPQGNQGLVPNTAKLPSNPGNILPGQTIASLTFQSGISQRRIRITMDPATAPFQTPGSIAIIDEAGNIIWSSGDTDNASGAIQFIQPDDPALSSLVIISGSGLAQTSDQLIVEIQNSSSTATGIHSSVAGSGDAINAQHNAGLGYPLRLVSVVTFNDHFSQMVAVQGFPGSSHIWVSDGTNPNGTLSGAKGDICLNSSATGQMAYCTGTTNWTLL